MHPNKANFIEGLSLILKRWTALQLSVEMEWGGPFTAQKAQDLEGSLIEYFEKEGKNLEPEDIEDILFEVMKDEFGAVLEDGSEVEVAKAMWTLFQQSIKGETALLQKLRQSTSMNQSVLTSCIAQIEEGEPAEDVSEGEDILSGSASESDS